MTPEQIQKSSEIADQILNGDPSGPAREITQALLVLTEPQPVAELESYFVAEDAYGDVHLWSGREGDDDCQPLIARRTLDGEHPALWPALLRGLAMAPTAPTTSIEYVCFEDAPFVGRTRYVTGEAEATTEVSDDYANLPKPFLDMLIQIPKQPDIVHCWRCNDPVGFVLHQNNMGFESLKWTPTGLARETGRDNVAVLCEQCTPFVPVPEEAQAAR